MPFRLLLLLLPLVVACSSLFEDPDADLLRNSALLPVEVVGNRTWSDVEAGFQHTCALTTAGAAYCWGENSYLQSGSSVDVACAAGSRCVNTPTAVSGGHVFTQIAAGGNMSCGLTEAGAVWCWGGGSGTEGTYLGNNTFSRSATPVRVASDSVFTTVTSVSGGGCALTTSGQAWCWGQNASGLLGDSTTINRPTPVAIGGALRFTRIVYHWSHRCGITTAGALYCWGDNRMGQLAIGEVPFNNINGRMMTPTAAMSADTYIDVAAGGVFTCAVRTDGQTQCAGYNSVGQLGDDALIDSRGTLSAVAGGLVATQISADETTACILIANGNAYCWGGNWYGAVGIGRRSDYGESTPQLVLGGPFTKISVGGSHACAISTEQRLYCWGDDNRAAVGRP